MISDSVGQGGRNRATDVTTVKEALGANGFTVPARNTMDPATIDAIRAFQRSRSLTPEDGRVDPRGQTLQALWPVVYANPTGRAIRGTDGFGSGAFGAGRGSGRTHDGTDWVTVAGDSVRAPMSGRVSTLSSPYRSGVDSDVLSGVQIDASNGYLCWIWYMAPSTDIVGDLVHAGDVIGVSLTLQNRYAGITDHLHIRIHNAAGAAIDPATLIP